MPDGSGEVAGVRDAVRRALPTPLKRALRHAQRAATVRHAMRTLARAVRAGSPEPIVDAVFGVRVGDVKIAPVQIRSELVSFASAVHAERPRFVLEIGTSDGGSLGVLAWASAGDARVLSLDLRSYEPHRLQLFRAYARERQVVEARQADSHSEETRAMVAGFFGGQELDVLFIDGDHADDGVRRDYELYVPLVRPGGLIAFHDIVDGPPESVGGVPRFWREIRGSLDDTREIVESWQQGGFGIGLGRRRAPAEAA